MSKVGRYQWDVRTPMRDGVELSTDLHLPPGGLEGGPYPAILVRTPAGNHDPALVAAARVLSDAGFALALQDVRGREDSAGTFEAFCNEGPDGYDAIEWIAAQPWCNGKVAMMGAGYAGWAQWAAAKHRPPHLVALASTSAWTGPSFAHRNGAPRLAALQWLHSTSARVWQTAHQVAWEQVLRQLPTATMDRAIGRDIPRWREWLDHQSDDTYWAEGRLVAEDFAGIDVPALHITGWYDDAQSAALAIYEGMSTSSPAAADQVLVVGPWDHAGTQKPRQYFGGADFGEDSCEDLAALHLRWFTRWLQPGAQHDASPTETETPTSRCFATGTNAWSDRAWAPSTHTATYYLRSDEGLSETAASDEPGDTFVHDPLNPVVLSPETMFFPAPRIPGDLPLDQRFAQRRDDVLVYTSAELADGLGLEGRPRIHLHAQTDRDSADWFVHLSDVDPEGRSMLITSGAARVHGTGEQQVAIELDPTVHVLRPGHRLRLTVSSSALPFYARNLGTADGDGTPAQALTASHVVHHDAARPTRLVLPVTASGSAI